ncbi:hypothetical protein [Clostridium butyricum]|uniref:hypothetical protein n=2 Tax=Clostridium TaxID=1485 RepID=UPI00374E4DDF
MQIEECIILGNGLSIRKCKKEELSDAFQCSQEEVEEEVENYPKVELIYSEISSIIGGKEISKIKNPGIYSLLEDEHVVAIKGEFEISKKIYYITICEKSYKEKDDVKTIEVKLEVNCDNIAEDNIFYEIKIIIKNCIKLYYKELYFLNDTQNEKICSGFYQLVYKNENKFRSIINKYMIKKYGVDRFKNIIDE